MCTCCISHCKLKFAATGAVRKGRRGGLGLRGHGGLGRLAICTCMRTPTQCSCSHHRREPARPLGLAADAAMFASRPLLPLPAAAKAVQTIMSMQPTPRLSRQQAWPRPARQQRNRTGSLRAPHQACAAAGDGIWPKLALRAAPGVRGGDGDGGRTPAPPCLEKV